MSQRQVWIAVIAIAAALGVGTWALVRYVPAPVGTTLGQRLPDFHLVELPGGDSVGVRSAFAGHVTLVNLWATWCAPCVKEMPSIERLYQAYRARGFRVAAVSIDQGESAPVLAFTRKLGLTFNILHDRSSTIEDRYRTIGVPDSYLLDAQGRIRYIALGAETWDAPENRARVEQLLGADD